MFGRNRFVLFEQDPGGGGGGGSSGGFQCDGFQNDAFDSQCLVIGPPPEWPENIQPRTVCGTVTVHDLLAYLHRVFDKDPAQELLFRLRYDAVMTWSVSDGALITNTTGGSGGPLTLDLSTYTVGELTAYLAAQPGYSIVYQNTAWDDFSALVLVDGMSGNQDVSNGDHVYGYTSILWAYLSALALELKTAKKAICEMVRQMVIGTAEDVWLDHLGGYYGVPRLVGESDAKYGPRIIWETLRPKGNNMALAAAIEASTGQYADVVDALNIVAQPVLHYYDGTYMHDGTILHDSVGAPFMGWYGLFDVVVGYDLLGDSDPAEYRDKIIAQVNRLRDAGTFLRQITLIGDSLIEDQDATTEHDVLILDQAVVIFYDGMYLHNGIATHSGVPLPQEIL